MIYVVAYDYRAYLAFCRDIHIAPHEALYVKNADILRGCLPAPYVLYGDWHKRQDYDEIEEMLKVRRMFSLVSTQMSHLLPATQHTKNYYNPSTNMDELLANWLQRHQPKHITDYPFGYQVHYLLELFKQYKDKLWKMWISSSVTRTNKS